MKNGNMKRLSLACVISLLFECNEKKEQVSVDKEQVKKDIQAREDEFSAVFNSGTLKDIGYYADDATTFLPNTAPLVGKPAIIAFFESDLGAKTDTVSYTHLRAHETPEHLVCRPLL